MHVASVLVGALAATLVAAHPGHDEAREMQVRNEFLNKLGHRDLSHCAEKLRARGIEARAIKRRAEKARLLMKKRGLDTRDADEVLATDHEVNACSIKGGFHDSKFAGNNSCILSPEVTEGPYYVTGEHIRSYIREDQDGVPMHTDVQILDVNTCEPVVGAYMDIWHCNSTGVYSGVIGQDNGDSEVDRENLDRTFNRGVQVTNEDGVVSFDTNVPGHYLNRTVHMHVMVHLNVEAQPNGTLIDTTAAHVGQLYFDTSLYSEVRQLEPYSTNEIPLLTNENDFLFIEAADVSDPVMNYVRLGESLQDGLLSWIAFGIDTTTNTEVSNIAQLTEDGGVTNEDSHWIEVTEGETA